MQCWALWPIIFSSNDDPRLTLTYFTAKIMSPPGKGRETYCSSPCFCLSVWLSVTKSCLLHNVITVTDISMKLHTFVKHIETMCHAQEP